MGQYFDAETGLHYNYHRYYDPSTGRYLTADPIGLAGGINLFAYTHNNPVNMIDPDGLIAIADDLIIASGALIIGSAYYAMLPPDQQQAMANDVSRFWDWLWTENTEDGDADSCGGDDTLDDYPANPDDWNPPDGWEETEAGKKSGGKHRHWKGPNGELRKWDREGRESGKERGPHWHDPRYPGKHIPPNR